MSHQPPPLEYQSNLPGPRPPRVGSGWMWLAGIACGFVISAVAWPATAITFTSVSDSVALLIIIPAVAIAVKVWIAWLIDKRLTRAGFLPGVLLSILLIPLIGIGTLALICSNMNFH